MRIFDIIKFDGQNDVLVWKFPGEDFNTLSQLIVGESQEAVFYKDGKVLDMFGPGRYTLHTQNIPLIRRLVNLPFNGESPFCCQVYFINKVVSMDIMWGTSEPMSIQDAIYKIILPIRANGQFAVRVIDSRKLLINLVGNISEFNQNTLRQYFKGILMTNIKDYISQQFVQNQISFLEIHSHLREIANGIEILLRNEFLKYGIEILHFSVNEIAPPENDPSYLQLKSALAKKAEMSVIGYNYQQERAFDLLDVAAANEGMSSNIMGAGMGLGLGVNLGNVISETMGHSISGIGAEQKIYEEKSTNRIKRVCPRCGAHVPEGKFCLECGSSLEIICRKCGAPISPGAKFCMECGNKVGE